MKMATRSASCLIVIALVLGAPPARAETVNCTPITALPAVIAVQGVYCLTGDLGTKMTSGYAIDIQTNNVVLDLNGHKLSGQAAGLGTTTYGVHAGQYRQNITVKNGTVRGFFYGILLQGDGSGHIVEDIRADRNTFAGIVVLSSSSIIRNNLVVATGGTTATGIGPNAPAYGIDVFEGRVLNNDVIDTGTQGTGTAFGIFLMGTGSLAVNNRITAADQGITFVSTGKYRDNLTFGVATPYVGGTDAGNNN